MGLRIIERVREEYGGDADAHLAEELNPFTNPSRAKKALQAETGTNAALSRGPFAYADDEGEDIGGGFLVKDDDPNSGGFLPEGHDAEEGRHRAGELTIEDDRGPVEKGSLKGTPSADPDEMSCELPDPDDSQGAMTEADSEDDRVAVAQKVSRNGKRAAETMASLENTYSRKKRAAEKGKAAGNSETVFSSCSFEDESGEDDSSNRGMLRSKEVTVNKAAKRKR